MKYLFLILFIGINHLVNAQKMTPLEKAEDYFLDHKYQRSLKLLRKIIQRNPNDYQAYLLIARNYFYLKESLKQEQAHQKALSIAPKKEEVYLRYGDFLSGKKRLEDAKEIFEKGVQQLPQNARMCYQLGAVMLEMKNYKKALEWFNKAIALDSNKSIYWYFKGRSEEELNLFTEAKISFDKSIKIDPNDADLYNKRGRFRLALKDYEGALADYQKAEKLDSIEYKGVVKEARDDIGRIYSDKAEKLEKTNPTKALVLAKQALKMLAPGTYLDLTKKFVKRLEAKLTEQKAGDQFWAPYQKEYDQALELMQAKKYKEAFKILDKITKVVLKDDRYILHPFYEKASVAWDKCFKLKRLNLKKEDD